MLRQAGALQVRDLDELLDTLVALRYLGRPTGARMAILTGPGGPAVSGADACEEAGLKLADLAEQTKRRLRGVVASAGTSVGNPVDIGLVLAGAGEMYRQALAATLDDPGVDAAVVIGSSPQGEGWQEHVAAVAELARAVAKPVLHVAFGPRDPDIDAALAAHGVPSFSRRLFVGWKASGT